MRKRVVVTGIGAVTPIGNNVPDFWDGLKSGKNGIGVISRFDPSRLRCQVGAEVRDFDPSLCFDFSTMNKTDRYTQFAVAAAQEAVDDSGILGKVEPDEFGVYVGSGIGGIDTLCTGYRDILIGGRTIVNPHYTPMMIINIASGNIAMRFNAHGPAMCVSTACATGSTAIGEAYRAIRDGYLTAVIAGGSESALNELGVIAFLSCLALTRQKDPSAASLPFDKRRAGFVMGEGAGILVLEEYDHAVARGARIYAEIAGYGATCDAHHVTAPDPEATQTVRAIKLALENVDCVPEKLYVNAHGTGTKMNDKVETKAFKDFFGEDAYKLHISSTKSMTGHMLGAAGAVEAIACILAMKEGIVPPTINLDCPDPECDLDYTPNRAVSADIDTAISTSLGFGGHNVCLAFRKVK